MSHADRLAPASLVTAVDETVVVLGSGVTYALVAVTVLNRSLAAAAATAIVAQPGRTRPFHWHREGRVNRARAVDLIQEHAVATHVIAKRASRSRQVDARRELMFELAARLAQEQVELVIIESRGAVEDRRDQHAILDCFRERGDRCFEYEWHTKAEPMLWYADALAGVVREQLSEGSSIYLRDTDEAESLAEVVYLG